MYIQADSSRNNQNAQNFKYIQIAELIACKVNSNIPEALGLSLIFDGSSVNTRQHSEHDYFPKHTKILSELINEILVLDKKFEDRDDYLILLLKFMKDNILNNHDKKIVKEMFFNFYLNDFFDDISATFLRDKLNYYLK
ncbi:hypothetical protein [Flavobacterium sp. FlaQc-28]|uniref:hypothetical protein n=1 Tax=Flavobacterium sp. FlaQc-28 TaxID=3374178 RepID=UPI003757A2C7